MNTEYTPPTYRSGAHIEAWDGTHGVVRAISRDHSGIFYHIDGVCLRQDQIKGVLSEPKQERYQR
jgi:hypothetical protein